jgi:hypothetical protein
VAGKAKIQRLPRLNNLHTVHIVSSHFLHNSPLSSITKARVIEIERGRCKGEEAMRVKGMLGGGVTALVSTMSSPFLGADRSEARGADEEDNGVGQRQGKSVRRKVLRDDFIVFAAVASAYLLTWVASLAFRQ